MVGDSAACSVYRAFLFHLLERLKLTADQRTVVVSPPQQMAEFQRHVPPVWDLKPQSEGDLGQRMQAFFEEQFGEFDLNSMHQPPCKIVVIGADCPLLGNDQLNQAFDELDNHDVVIGPSEDGGYYLIGMRGQCFPIFDNIAWSTESVLDSTLRKLADQGIGYQLLSTRRDVDEIQDLDSLMHELHTRHRRGDQDSMEQNLLTEIQNAVAPISEKHDDE